MAKEFREEEHPRDKEGKFTDGVGTQAEQKRLEQMGISSKEKTVHNNLTNEEKRLQELTGEKVEIKKQRRIEIRQRQQKQVKQLLETKPVVFNIGKKKLNIAFTDNTVGKNLAKRFNSDIAGLNWKHKNLSKLPKVLECLKYDTTKKEIGKNTLSHDGVKEWHYLTGEYTDGDKTFKVNANIADKGNEQFLYELSLKKKKEPTK